MEEVQGVPPSCGAPALEGPRHPQASTPSGCAPWSPAAPTSSAPLWPKPALGEVAGGRRGPGPGPSAFPGHGTSVLFPADAHHRAADRGPGHQHCGWQGIHALQGRRRGEEPPPPCAARRPCPCSTRGPRGRGCGGQRCRGRSGPLVCPPSLSASPPFHRCLLCCVWIELPGTDLHPHSLTPGTPQQPTPRPSDHCRPTSAFPAPWGVFAALTGGLLGLAQLLRAPLWKGIHRRSWAISVLPFHSPYGRVDSQLRASRPASVTGVSHRFSTRSEDTRLNSSHTLASRMPSSA